jgi:hypothetical protein
MSDDELMSMFFHAYIKLGLAAPEYFNLSTIHNKTEKEIMQMCDNYAINNATHDEKKIYYNMKAKNVVTINEHLLRYAFDVCVNTRFDDERLLDISQSLNLPVSLLKSYAKRYYEKRDISQEQKRAYDIAIVKHRESMISKYIEDFQNKPKNLDRGKIYEKLLTLKSPEEIIKYLESEGVHDVRSLKSSAYIYAEKNKFLGESAIDIENKIKAAIDIYNEYLKEMRKKGDLPSALELELEEYRYDKDIIEEATRCINSFVCHETISLGNFIDGHTFITKNRFNFFVSLVKKYDIDLYCKYLNKVDELVKQTNEDLYKKYEKKINSLKETRFAVLKRKISKVIEGIKNGVKLEDGSIRPFDVLDYFSYTNLPIETVADTFKGHLSKQDIAILRRFIKKINLTPLSGEESILKEKNTFIKDGVPYVATDNDKLAVINYLKENGALYNTTYYIALRRYIASILVIEENKTSKK